MYTLSFVCFSFLVKPKLVDIYEASREGNCITVKWKKQGTGNCLLAYEVSYQSNITGEMVFTEPPLENGKLTTTYCSPTAAIINSTWVKAIKGKLSGELNSRSVINLKPTGKN